MKLCPTCGRKPSERIGVDREMVNECGYDIEARYPTAPCPDPLHDAADRVGEMCDAIEFAIAFFRSADGAGQQVVIDTLRSALPEVPR